MLGWRARVGNIDPSRGETFAYEFYQMVPKGVVLVSTSTNLRELTVAELERVLSEFDKAAERLAYEEVDILRVGGNPIMALKGIGSDKELSARIESATGIPTLCGFTAVVEALQALSIKKVAVATPFNDEVNERHKKFLEDSGFTITNLKKLERQRVTGRPVETANLPPYASYRVAKEAFLEAPDSDGIYLACARWQTALNIATLEKDLKVPVVTDVQASVWGIFKRIHIVEINPGFGQLFDTL